MQGKQRLLTATFASAFMANFFMALNFSNNSIYPLYITSEGGGAAEIGAFMGVFSLSAVLGRPLIGLLIDRWGIRRVWLLGAAAMALPSIGYYLLLGKGLVVLVWILRAIQGLGFGTHFTAFFTLAGNTAPIGRRTETIAKYGLSGIMAMMIGPYLGEQLFTRVGTGTFLLAMTGFGVIAGLFIMSIREAAVSFPPERLPLSDFFRALRSKPMRQTLLLALLMSISFSSVSSFLAPVSLERGINGFALYFTGFAVSGTVIRLTASTWGDRFGQRRVLVPGFFLYTVALLILSFGHSLTTIVIAGLVAGIAHGISFPAVTSYGYSLAPPAHAGSVMALVTGVMDGGGALSAFSLGKVAELTGFGAVFPLASLAPALAMIIVVISLLGRPQPVRSRDNGPSAT